MTGSASPFALDGLPASVQGGFEQAFSKREKRQRLIALLALAIVVPLVLWSFQVTGFWGGQSSGRAVSAVLDFLARMNPELRWDSLLASRETEGSLAHWYNRWPQWRAAMVETLQIALLSTAIGSVLGLVLGFLCARTIMPVAGIRWSVRRIMEIFRTIPSLVMAIILVAIFGLGPLAGLITLIVGNAAMIGRLMGDALENVDPAPREALRAAGAGEFQRLRYGVFPQIAPSFISFSFLMFEINVGASTTLGLVGAGGIGAELMRALTFNQYQSYFAILIMIVIVVVMADALSEQVRHRMAESRGAM